jgi:hypothetical protein
MSQIHSPECSGTDNFNAVSKLFKSLDSSWLYIETLLFLSRNTCFQAGVVVDDVRLNATSVHKPVTECHFFVKAVISM